MKRKTVLNTLLQVVLLAVLAVQVYPIFWIVSTSLKTSQEVQTNSTLALPEHLYFGNYIRAWQTADLGLYFRNSLVVTLSSVVLIVLVSATAAFAIEKMKFRHSKLALSFFLLGMTIPIHVTLIPMFQIYRSANLLNTHLALILPQIGFNLPMSIYLFTAFYKFIPNAMLEAAVIDGASIWRSFLRIIFPMSKNTIVTVVTMNGIFTWNEFIFANTFISKSALKTIPVGLYDYIGERGMVDWGATFSAITLFLIPLLLVYFLLNKEIISGMTAGAMKE